MHIKLWRDETKYISAKNSKHLPKQKLVLFRHILYCENGYKLLTLFWRKYENEYFRVKSKAHARLGVEEGRGAWGKGDGMSHLAFAALVSAQHGCFVYLNRRKRAVGPVDLHQIFTD